MQPNPRWAGPAAGAVTVGRWDPDAAPPHGTPPPPGTETLEQAMFRRCDGGAKGHYAPHPAQGPLADTQLALNWDRNGCSTSAQLTLRYDGGAKGHLAQPELMALLSEVLELEVDAAYVAGLRMSGGQGFFFDPSGHLLTPFHKILMV